MRTIEITTTQNVTIEYELASVGERMAAFLIDFFIILVGIIILNIIFSIVASHQFQTIAYYVVLLPIFLFYSLVSDIFGNGRSLGKRAVKLKVVKLTGKEGSASDYLIRWAFRMIDIYFSLGSVGMLLVSSTSKAQRLGDIVANTAVIRIKPRSNLLFKDIMKLDVVKKYQPMYPQVRQMNDKEMLLVKNVLERLRKYPNKAHKEAVSELAEALCQRLNIAKAPSNEIEFLRTLLNDYVVLTR